LRDGHRKGSFLWVDRAQGSSGTAMVTRKARNALREKQRGARSLNCGASGAISGGCARVHDLRATPLLAYDARHIPPSRATVQSEGQRSGHPRHTCVRAPAVRDTHALSKTAPSSVRENSSAAASDASAPAALAKRKSSSTYREYASGDFHSAALLDAVPRKPRDEDFSRTLLEAQ
jgi:hypothetical protein